ncbi:MAG TPA: thiamine pyrophosphate-dependent enzyme, partial [Holophaga sp.]|nr:thiamine pyrophosphate-dependent enzyme [Holophaga sp.]
WIDLPLDVQGAMVEERELQGFEPPPVAAEPLALAEIVDALTRAKRPLILAGNGIHRGRAQEAFLALLEQSGLPVVMPFSAKDLVWEDHPQNMGIFGTAGQRRANFAIQNADCILSLASGLCITKTGFNIQGFAPKAFKILVDIDEGQLHHQPIQADLAVQADIGPFIKCLLEALKTTRLQPDPRWAKACRRWRQDYPILAEAFMQDTEHVNTYVFMDRLAEAMEEGDTLVTGNGMDIVSHYQAFKVKRGQRTIVTANWGAMGWDLPLAVGAGAARPEGRTVLVTGDGSFLWNVQELMTIRKNALPIKIFVFNNQGYSSIRATQNAFFNGFFVGADASSGVANPDFAALAQAFGLTFSQIRSHKDLEAGIARVISMEGPCLCEVNISPDQAISPKASAFRREDGTFESRPLEDMAPFLPREEVWENMHLFDDTQP